MAVFPGHLKRGIQIIYVPDHADGDATHPDCQPGFVTSVAKEFAFCRYWRMHNGMLVVPPDLRTKGGSEATRFKHILIADTVDQELVAAMLEEYC